LIGLRQPLAEKVFMCTVHVCGVLGCAQLSQAVMYLFLAYFYNAQCYTLIGGGMIFYSVMGLITQFTHPAGTGDEDSPKMGPVPVLVLLISFPAVMLAAGIQDGGMAGFAPAF